MGTGLQPTLIVTRGLPASGKTTAAKRWQAADPARRVRINRDDLRLAGFGVYVLKHKQEELITKVQRVAVVRRLRMGLDVIADDTNLTTWTLYGWRDLAYIVKARLIVWDFLCVPIDHCIESDRQRGIAGQRCVGSTTITDMARRIEESPRGFTIVSGLVDDPMAVLAE